MVEKEIRQGLGGTSFAELVQVLVEEREALYTWLNADLPSDVREGINISIAKVEYVLIKAGTELR